MEKLVCSFILTCMVGLLSACSNSSGGGGAQARSNLIGTWTGKSLVNSQDAAQIKRLGPPSKGSSGYIIADIHPDGSVIFTSQGTYDSEGVQKTDIKVEKYGRVENGQASESLFYYDEQFLRKRLSVPEEQVQEILKTPLTFKINSDSELEMFDSKKENRGVWVKIDSAGKTQLQAETAKAISYVTQEKPALKAALAGKTFALFKIKRKSQIKGGEVFESTENADQISKMEDEIGSGKNLIIQPKKLVFSENFQDIVANDKRRLTIGLTAGFDYSFVFFAALFKTDDSSSRVVVGGRIVLTDEGFEIHEGFESKDVRTEMIRYFKRGP